MRLTFTEPIADNRFRIHLAVVLWSAVIWQLYTVVVAFRNASVLAAVVPALGAEQPLITVAFLSWFRFFVAAPVVTGVLAVHILAKKRITLLHSIVVVLFALLVAAVLQAWSTEAIVVSLSPLLEAGVS